MGTRPALAGLIAAAAWAAAEPALGRLVGTPYSDVRLLGAPLSRRRWRLAGTAAHLANGAAAALAFERLGLRGWKAGLVVFQVENVAAWPLMAVADRVHPDRRSGAWPPLLGNGRVFGYEAVTHALFGVVLGALLRDETGGR